MPNYKITVAQVDALLPQTQCGECSYGGCLPYAKAIVNNGEAINRCPPGGVAILQQLGDLLQTDVSMMVEEMTLREKPPMLAKIREQDCIGCTKCLQACPIDAIVGAAKQMHSILESECTGCGLCLPPCPVDCIELVPTDNLHYNKDKARSRFYAKKRRQTQESLVKNQREKTKETNTLPTHTAISSAEKEKIAKQAAIRAAVLRVKAKRLASSIDNKNTVRNEGESYE